MSDPERARSIAHGLAADLARKHHDELERLGRAADVWTALAEPLAAARRRFESKVKKRFHENGVFEEAIHEKVIAPVEARIDREREAEDREAIREDRGYREADERPKPPPPSPPPAPAKERRPKKEKKPRPDTPSAEALADQRNTGNIFLGIGLFMTIAMGSLAIGVSRKDSRAARVQSTYVSERCTMLESKDVPAEGGMREHVVKFEHRVGERRFTSDQYSPDLPHGPGAQWFPVGREVECFCDPKDPASCYLYRGQDKNRESIPWMFIVLFPLLWLGIGLAMRNAKTVMEGD